MPPQNDDTIHPDFISAMQALKVCVLTDQQEQRRVVEPYGIFMTRQKHLMYCCHQLAGYSSGPLPAWRNFHIGNIKQVEVTTRSFRKRSDFNPDNKDSYYRWIERI